MLEYHLINRQGDRVGTSEILEKGQSRTAEIPAGGRRVDRFTIDFSGVVSSQARRDKYRIFAIPSGVRAFNGEEVQISDALAPDQRVTYRRNLGRAALKRLTDDIPVGVVVYRRPLPIAEVPAA